MGFGSPPITVWVKENYALADIDRKYVRKSDGEEGVLERKNCTYHKASDWVDGAYPIYYEFQLRFYLAVKDLQHGAFSATWGNNPDNDKVMARIFVNLRSNKVKK